MNNYIRELFIGRPLPKTINRLARHKHVLIGFSIVALLLVLSIFAPLIAPHNPIEQDLESRLSLPSWEYPLGADNLGRCIFSRILFGTRVSLLIALIVIAITSAAGTIIGLVSGYFGGILDAFLMRIVDVLLSLPAIIIALLIAGILGPSLFNIMLALTLVGWTGYARVMRSSVLSVRKKEFVLAEQALGAGHMRILFFHILPNAIVPILVMMTLGMGYVILTISALSFIGLGAQPPTPELGSMLNSGRAFMQTAPHVMVFPGLAIMIAVLGFNFLGNGLRDVLFQKS